MTNPMTILSFAGLFAALGATASGVVGAMTVTGGVVAGSMAWWVVLAAVVGRIRARVTIGALTWVNRVSGAVVALFGVAAMAGALAAR